MSSALLRVRAPAPAAIAILAIALTVAACSKGEPESGKPRPNAPLQYPKPVESTAPAPETNEALRERLARQEAASKMFDKPETPKPLPPKPENPKVDAPKAEGPLLAAPRIEPTRIEPPKAEPPRPEPLKPEPAKIEAPKVEAKTAPAAVEAAAPKPAAPSSAARLVTRVDPEFPREALKAGAHDGSVKARVTLDAAGAVTRVDIIEATPRRVFDRAVTNALSQWKYSEGAAGRQVDVEVAFKR
jgi:protein TonB